MNLQPRGSVAKPYQVKQVRAVIIRYEIILYWNVDEDAFIAEVTELAGCAADDPTRQDALSNAEVVIQEWIETAREFGSAYT